MNDERILSSNVSIISRTGNTIVPSLDVTITIGAKCSLGTCEIITSVIVLYCASRAHVSLIILIWAYDRFVPVTTISTSRLPHLEQTKRSRQSRTSVPAPSSHLGRIGLSWHSLHQTFGVLISEEKLVVGKERLFQSC